MNFFFYYNEPEPFCTDCFGSWLRPWCQSHSFLSNEPPHDKTNKMVCAPSKDSDQPGHPSRLIRVFAVRMKKGWVLRYPLSASEDSDQTWRMPRLIWVFAGRTVILLVLSRGGSVYSGTFLCFYRQRPKVWK